MQNTRNREYIQNVTVMLVYSYFCPGGAHGLVWPSHTVGDIGLSLLIQFPCSLLFYFLARNPLSSLVTEI
jgi:hypothetical protein